MNFPLRVFIIIGLVAAALGAGALIGYRVKYAEGFENVEKFESLEPGISLTTAQNILGEPMRIEHSDDGRYDVYYYETPSLMAESLRFKLRNSDNIITEVRISEIIKRL